MDDFDFFGSFNIPFKQEFQPKNPFKDSNALTFDKKIEAVPDTELKPDIDFKPDKSLPYGGGDMKFFDDSPTTQFQDQDILVYVQAYKEKRDQEAFNKIMDYLEPTIQRGIKIFGQGNEALRGQAKLLVINALDTYDPKKGDLRTHVLLHLQRLRRLQGQSNPVSVPESIKLTLIQIQQAEAELRDNYGRPPSDQEIADYLGISIKKIQKAREYSQGMAESTMEGVGAVTEKQVNLEQERKELWIQAIYVDLSPVEQYILDAAYGRNGKKKQTLQEIAEALNLPLSTVHAKLKKIEELIQLGDQL